LNGQENTEVVSIYFDTTSMSSIFAVKEIYLGYASLLQGISWLYRLETRILPVLCNFPVFMQA